MTTIVHEQAIFAFYDLKRFLAERNVAKFMWPERLEIVSDLPMTPTRKVIKHELVRQLLAQSENRSRPAA